MGTSIDLYKYDYDTLVKTLVAEKGISDVAMLEKILLKFGEKIGTCYILLNNEYYEDYNSFYSCSSLIDNYFKVEDSFDIFLGLRKEVNCNQNTYEVAEELGIEYNDD